MIVLCFNIGAYAAYVFSATDVSYTKSNGSTVSVKEALDELNNKVPTKKIGEEVTYKGEQFYVLGWNNENPTVEIITKYNLNSSYTAQTSSYTGVDGESASDWPDNAKNNNGSINNMVKSVGYCLKGARKYADTLGAISGRLLTKEEHDYYRTNNIGYRIVYCQYKFWLANAYSTNGPGDLYYANGTGATPYTGVDFASASLRPVLLVKKSDIS